jgi:hypothetical protein
MSSRTATPIFLALILLVLALVAPPVQAQTVSPVPPAGQCQAHPVCGSQAPGATSAADLFVPQTSSKATLLGADQFIGGCCPNNDSTQCPAVGGYSSVHCGFPMCASGFLTCIYS